MKVEIGTIRIEEGTTFFSNRRGRNIIILPGKYPLYANVLESNATPSTYGGILEAYAVFPSFNDMGLTASKQILKGNECIPFHYKRSEKELIAKVLGGDKNISLHPTFHIRKNYHVFEAKLLEFNGVYFNINARQNSAIYK